MINQHLLIAFSTSFWIIPREGTEALLIILMLCTALKQSDRGHQLHVIYWGSGLALIAGAILAIGCIVLSHLFTGQARELSEAFASLIAMSMLLYVNFSVFQGHKNLSQMTLLGFGLMAFISVFRELTEVILFYIALLQGNLNQQLGTLAGIGMGMILLMALVVCYHIATDKWKSVNRFIFNITPFFLFILALMCIGNAVNAFQEANWLGFHSVSWMFNNNLFHVQSSREYLLAIGVFIASTGLLFLKQFSQIITRVFINQNTV